MHHRYPTGTGENDDHRTFRHIEAHIEDRRRHLRDPRSHGRRRAGPLGAAPGLHAARRGSRCLDRGRAGPAPRRPAGTHSGAARAAGGHQGRHGRPAGRALRQDDAPRLGGACRAQRARRRPRGPRRHAEKGGGKPAGTPRQVRGDLHRRTEAAVAAAGPAGSVAPAGRPGQGSRLGQGTRDPGTRSDGPRPGRRTLPGPEAAAGTGGVANPGGNSAGPDGESVGSRGRAGDDGTRGADFGLSPGALTTVA